MKANPIPTSNRKKIQSGVAMIELLLAVFVILIGLLGMSALQVKVANANVESYQRAQALVLLEGMVERFNANRKLQTCLAISGAGTGIPYLGQPAVASDPNLLDVSGGTYSCTATGTASDANAKVELASWDSALKGSSETIAGSSVGGFLGARGCISSAAATDTSGMTVFTLAVAWQGSDPGVAASNSCAVGTYGADDTLRRVVWTTLRVADLN